MYETLIFKNQKIVWINRYFYGLFFVFCFYIILPIMEEGNVLAILDFIRSSFSRGLLGISLLLVPVIFIQIIFGNLNTSQHTKSIIIKDSCVIIKLFGTFKEKLLQLNYSDIASLEWSKDNFKHFLFNLKNGEEKLIKTEIYDREKAFDLIQEKIKEMVSSKDTIITN